MALDVQNQQPQPLQQVHASGSPATGLIPAAVLRRPAAPVTLDLFRTSHPSPLIELHKPPPLLNLKIGNQVYSTKMSHRRTPRLDLKLNLSPPQRPNFRQESPGRSATQSPTSPPSSCVSSELNQDDGILRYSDSPEATSMLLVGCPRCLMYVMLAEEDPPRCPKCKSTVLLDIVRQNTASTTTTTATPPTPPPRR